MRDERELSYAEAARGAAIDAVAREDITAVTRSRR
jgi:hypothetical protein